MSHPASPPRLARFVLFLTGVGLLPVLACLFTAGEDQLPELAPEVVRAAADESSAGEGERFERHATQAPLGCLGAPAGATFRYRVTDRSDYEVRSAEAGSQPAGAMRVECFVTTTVLARRDDEVLVRQHVEELQFLAADGRAIVGDPIQQGFVAATAAPVLARLDGHGAVLGYGFAEGLDGDQRNFLRGMLAVLVFQAPGDRGSGWTCEEMDTTGTFEARYEVLPCAAADEVAVRRTRLAYKAMGQHTELPVHTLRGAGEARFSTQLGWLRGTQIDEGMTMALPLLDLQAVANRSAQAALVATDRIEVEGDLVEAWRAAVAPATGRFEEVGQYAASSERRRWEQMLQGVTLDQLLAELAALLGRQPVDTAAQNEVFQRLQWLVKLDDRVAAAIGERLAMRELVGEFAGMALSSLGAAGTPAAQVVLDAVRTDRNLDGGIRETATIATLQLAEPSDQLVAGLARDAAADYDGRSSAMLVLGALSTRNGRPLPDGRTPVATLLAMEAEAAARGELPTWLLAVGNAAPPETLAIAERHLGSSDPAVRAAACVALRRVADAAAMTLLVERGLADAESMVRREAVLALDRRSERAVRTALERVASNDPDEDLRNRVRELLRSRA